MASRKPRIVAPPPLAWRVTRMREWREFLDLTLEEVVEALGALPEPIETTHASLGRIERGKQRPPIDVVEALAKLYKTDVNSMLNRRPGEPDDLGPIRSIWDNADEREREMIVDLARTATKPRR